ncbi:hypothetical protein CP500_001480 [Tychonema bourrellyi FEM_GT703]|uniref:Uncharacterized protein n=1 Tax=Tychonema bourrellyi FEM_GT703 TaxID=2040638 RepID=A0A2G4F631_9CYAN|nr:hypothetical protein CP500_001480 [Tychonema bourrellyi FEM_GT703]
MMIIYFLTINPPCFLRGVRGDLGLIVKQQSLTTFDVKLTPMGTAVSSVTIAVLEKVRYALCPMPYALCPMPYARSVPHLSEKGYIISEYNGN